MKTRLVCGRKHCSNCGHWRHAYEFSVSKRYADGSVRLIRPWCRTCERVTGRVRHGMKRRGTPYEMQRKWEKCIRGHSLDPRVGDVYVDTNGRHHCRVCRRLRTRKPEYKEWKRIYQEARRREAGIPRRPGMRRTQEPIYGPQGPLYIPAEPFARWLRRKMEHYETLKDLANALHMESSHLGHIVNDERGTIHIDTVDRALMQFCEQHLLNEWYPPVEVPA